jgi:hypothetical protein
LSFRYSLLLFVNVLLISRLKFWRLSPLICIYRRRMRTYQHTAFTVLDRYDILQGGHKRRGRRFRVSASIFRLICISLLHTLWNVFVIEVRFREYRSLWSLKELGEFRLG